jgi:glycosyltransferase involved in cell wall biosynthesis
MGSESLNVCVITTVSLTLKTFLIDQLVFLSKHGFSVSVVCDDDSDFARICPSELKYIPVRMTREFGVVTTLRGIWTLYRLFENQKYDMIQYATPKASFISSLAGRMASVPVRLYCQWGIRYIGSSGLPRILLKFLEKLTCYFSTNIAPDSRGNLDFAVAEKLYPPEKASVVFKGSANGVNLDKFDISLKEEWRKRVRMELGIDQKCFIFGFVGRITKDKGCKELITGFLNLDAEDDNLALLLVGEVEEDHKLPANIIQVINNHPRIYRVGHKDNPQDYIAAMDVMVLPSYREGFGAVAIEAQAMGVPVISTDIPGPREAIVNGRTGLLVSVANVESLTAAMKRLRNDQDLMLFFGNNALEFVKENFEQKKFWQRVLEHRRNLL